LAELYDLPMNDQQSTIQSFKKVFNFANAEKGLAIEPEESFASVRGLQKVYITNSGIEKAHKNARVESISKEMYWALSI
jgi:hypothetical protein